MNLATLDIVILAIYAVGIFVLAQWVSREKGEHKKDAQDYFLASRALPWWAIGTSLIAANISAEQIVGMSGSGYVMGMAIASYEWMAALTLIVVGKWILPVFLKNGIYTMPEFLERRYSPAVRNVMAVFWLALYIFVNLTSILWLGALAVNAMDPAFHDDVRPEFVETVKNWQPLEIRVMRLTTSRPRGKPNFSYGDVERELVG